MILAGLVLLAVGCGDLVRALVARHRLGYVAAAVGILLLGGLVAAIVPAAIAVVVAALWLWLMPVGIRGRPRMWPVVGLALACAGAVLVVPRRAEAGVLGALWHPVAHGRMGEPTIDAIVLVAGGLVFLLESANVIVRTALAGEAGPAVSVDVEALAGASDGVSAEASPAADGAPDSDGAPDASAAQPAMPASPPRPTLKGGRLIGPLERMLVFALTLVGAYPLVAAFVAAKGIVRFPEISRDGDRGDRAEYFLIGSMVSWVTALAVALVVWWANAR